jgi:MFS family permease
VLLGSLGIGAISGALLLPALRRRTSPRWLAAGASIVYAVSLTVAGLVPNSVAVIVSLVGAGFAWLTVLVHSNASMQLALPHWVRARGLSVYQLTFMGSQALAAAFWGFIAENAGIAVALVFAAALLVACAAVMVRWPSYDVAGLDQSPAVYWPLPALVLEPDDRDGPVVVTVRYVVSQKNAAAFVDGMKAVGRSRKRTGAVEWGLFRDGTDPEKFVEIFTVPSWDEHLRQHGGRLTGGDREVEERAYALTSVSPEVEHLFPAETPAAPVEA